MATKYCDHGLYAAPVAGGTAPSGGYAEDGDGSDPQKATAGTVVLTVTDYTQWVAGSDSLSVIGATATTIAAPSSNNDMASKLATAINASTATNASSTINLRTNQLRNLVNAVASGATVTIYSRTGGTAWNSLSVTSTKQAAFTETLPVTFSGATAGAWGYAWNTAALWNSAYAIGAYGLFARGLPMTGALAAGDKVKFRSGKTITVNNAAGIISILPPDIGTAASPVTYEIDDGNTVSAWTGDADFGLFHFTGSGGNAIYFYPATASVFIRIVGGVSAAGVRTFKISITGTGIIYYSPNSGIYTENAELSSTHASGAAWVYANLNGLATGEVKFKNLRIASLSTSYAFIYIASGANYGANFDGLELDNLTASVSHAGLVSKTGPGDFNLSIFGLNCLNFVSGSRLAATNVTPTNYSTFVDIRSAAWGNVTMRGPFMGGIAQIIPAEATFRRDYIGIASSLAGRDFSLDTARGFVEWTPSSLTTFPTRNGVLPSGTPYSLRIVPTQVAANVNWSRPFQCPRIATINSNADGARTIRVYFGIEKSLAWTKRDVSVLVEYVDTSGNLVQIDTFDVDAGALTADTSTWSIEGTGGDAGRIKYGSAYLDKYKFEVATPTGKDMDADCDVGVFFRVHSSVATTDKILMLDPEVGIT